MHLPQPVHPNFPITSGKKLNFLSNLFLSRCARSFLGFAFPATLANDIKRHESHSLSRWKPLSAFWSFNIKQWHAGQIMLHAPHSTHVFTVSSQSSESNFFLKRACMESFEGILLFFTCSSNSFFSFFLASSFFSVYKSALWNSLEQSLIIFSPLSEPISTT